MESTLSKLINDNFRFLYYCAKKYYPANSQDIDDVVQDSVIKMHKFYNKDKFSRSWMGQVVSSTALDRLKRKNRNVDVSEENYDYLEIMMSLNDDSFSREYQDHLKNVLKVSIDRMENKLHKDIIKEKLKGKALRKMKIKNTSEYKIVTAHPHAMEELKQLFKETLEAFEY